jgi:dolichol-phosphate mannosyltransferase
MLPESPDVSVVVPAFREAPNLRPLAERVFAATRGAGLDAELIIVDDSSGDGSAEIVADLAALFPVRIIVRTNERGLSSAVLRGFQEARGPFLVVMDADLSHPPEAIPDLVAPVREGRADFALGSRYVSGGHIDQDWSLFRHLNSRIATWLARPLTSVRDPMSGFFCLARASLERAAPLNPVGYKIALELIVKTRSRRCLEVPISFADRAAGTSKLTAREQLRYLRHLARLYWFRIAGPQKR